MTDLTDEAVKALLDRGEQLYNDAKHHVPLQARCADLARALLEARAENARLRADAQAAVAMVVEKIAPPDDTAAWAYGEDRRAGYQDAIDDLIAISDTYGLAMVDALRKALVEQNGLLVSALQIAKREGVDGEIASTNWDAYYNRVAVSLKRHHDTVNQALAALPAKEGE